ncbi:MAG TPA: Smr/MutS family protein, partial [Nitrolancea sp.]|nr:Smr/MutS family protein [Nitrolancea sp.]
AEARRLRRAAEAALREADEIRANARQEAIDEVAAELREARDLIRQARRPVPSTRAATERTADTQLGPPTAAEIKNVETQLRRVARRQRHASAPAEPLRVGDWVSIPNLGIDGEIVAFSDGGESVEVLSGSFRLTQPVTAVRRAPRSGNQRASARRPANVPPAPVVDSEIHLRGRRVHEIEDELDRYLDLAARANLPWVRIVHGKGSGALRAEVHDVLKRNALVDRFELADASAGGDGVTVAFLKD